MSKISLEGIASKMSANQMKNVTGGSGPHTSRCYCGDHHRFCCTVSTAGECARRCAQLGW